MAAKVVLDVQDLLCTCELGVMPDAVTPQEVHDASSQQKLGAIHLRGKIVVIRETAEKAMKLRFWTY